ncbi:MAG: hypothetical protein WA139_04145 [Candidatus Aenigmatarchaeota archaeon]
MKVKKVDRILSKCEINRLRIIIEIELKKPKNKKYYALLLMLIQDLEDISFHEHYASLLWFIRHYRTSTDIKIKNKLKNAYNDRSFDFDKYKEKNKQKFYKYTKKDYSKFLNRSEYFFSLYKKPFDIKNMGNKDYLNRTYLGLCFEFLLKAIFLKKRYIINQIKIKGLSHPVKSGTVRIKDLDTKTYELGHFIDLLPKLKPDKVSMDDFNYYVMTGLFLCQTWAL